MFFILWFFLFFFFFFSSRRRHTRYIGDWSSDVCSSDLRSGRSRALTGGRRRRRSRRGEGGRVLTRPREDRDQGDGNDEKEGNDEEDACGHECGRCNWRAAKGWSAPAPTRRAPPRAPPCGCPDRGWD